MSNSTRIALSPSAIITAKALTATKSARIVARETAQPPAPLVLTVKQSMSIAARLVDASVTFGKAGASYLVALTVSVKGVKPLTETDYDNTLAPAIRAAFTERHVNKDTADTQASQIKAMVLALVNGFKPTKGQTFGQALPDARTFRDAATINGVSIRRVTNGKVASGGKKGASGRPSAPKASVAVAKDGASAPSFGGSPAMASLNSFAMHWKLTDTTRDQLAFCLSGKDGRDQMGLFLATYKANNPA